MVDIKKSQLADEETRLGTGSDGVVAYIVSAGNGLESFIFREIDQLSGMGMDIALFTTKYKKNDIYSPRPEWKCFALSPMLAVFLFPVLFWRVALRPRLFMHAIRYGTLIELFFAVHYSPKMRQIGVRQIHCHFGDRKLFIGYYCKRLSGLPLSVTIHSHELHVNPNERMFRAAIKYCDRIFAISQLAVRLLTERYDVLPERIALNRLFLDMSIWSRKAPIRVITVARFEPQKGLDILFQAAALLKDLDIEFIVVGFGPLDVKALARTCGVERQVVFFDKLNQMQLRLLYQKCDIYCLPSIVHPEQGMEGIPVVLMEAMACGLPTVATRTGAVPEIVEDILVDQKSPEQMANAIRVLAENPDLRDQQGARNREIALKRHSVDNVRALLAELNDVAKCCANTTRQKRSCTQR